MTGGGHKPSCRRRIWTYFRRRRVVRSGLDTDLQLRSRMGSIATWHMRRDGPTFEDVGIHTARWRSALGVPATDTCRSSTSTSDIGVLTCRPSGAVRQSDLTRASFWNVSSGGIPVTTAAECQSATGDAPHGQSQPSNKLWTSVVPCQARRRSPLGHCLSELLRLRHRRPAGSASVPGTVRVPAPGRASDEFSTSTATRGPGRRR